LFYCVRLNTQVVYERLPQFSLLTLTVELVLLRAT